MSFPRLLKKRNYFLKTRGDPRLRQPRHQRQPQVWFRCFCFRLKKYACITYGDMSMCEWKINPLFFASGVWDGVSVGGGEKKHLCGSNRGISCMLPLSLCDGDDNRWIRKYGAVLFRVGKKGGMLKGMGCDLGLTLVKRRILARKIFQKTLIKGHKQVFPYISPFLRHKFQTTYLMTRNFPSSCLQLPTLDTSK